jgi:hypothetical protein
MPSPSFVFLTMPKGRGGKFTVPELEHLLDIIDVINPIGNPDWERVWDQHVAGYPTKEQTSIAKAQVSGACMQENAYRKS